jgi:hypothetical protein
MVKAPDGAFFLTKPASPDFPQNIMWVTGIPGNKTLFSSLVFY